MCRIRFMAGKAIQIRMRSPQREFSQGIVIEFPQCPAIGVMAVFTFRSQLVFVNIIRLVAIVAVAGCSAEPGADMTFLTGNRSMQANERKIRHIMVEPYPPSPASLIMTVSTLLSELSRVHIVNYMAAVTLRVRLFDIASVTGRAASLFMLSPQGELCFCVVVETCLIPVIR